ncbi:hypothetical protein JCM8115_005494 [Rhodotorula mucilaginosa]
MGQAQTVKAAGSDADFEAIPGAPPAATPSPSSSKRKRTTLIIGAGSSGLAAIQQALEAGLEPSCCEARPGVGGAWRFDADPGACKWDFSDDGQASVYTPGESDERGLPPPSPMYASLRTNVPTTLMMYREQHFPRTVGLFCRHDQVQDYLEEFAWPLLPYISFNTRIVSVRHTLPSDPALEDDTEDERSRDADHPRQRRWFASWRSTLSPDAPLESRQFDCVFVANGHYSRPYVPYTEGLRTFTGELSHARWYRNAKQFEDKTVLVIGNSASGYDITRELAASIHARREAGTVPPESLPRIYQAARSPPALGIPWDAPDAPEYSKEVGVFPPIRKIAGREIEFEDGRSVNDVDCIIFATGYYFSFPFLSPESAPFSSHPLTFAPPQPNELANSPPRPSAKGGLRIHHLDDRMLFYLPDPTLAFLGLPYLVIPFPLAQIQARLAALHFASSSRLPAPLTFKPNPAMEGPNGEEDGAPETRQTVTLGHPKQFDLHDRMLRETGDVRDDDDDGQSEAGQGGAADRGGLGGERTIWGLTSEAERDLRKGAKGLRKAVLGY